MRPMSFDLAGLLSPYEPAEFFSTFWEQRHLCIKRDRPRYYESLITAADLEDIIAHSDARYPAIRLSKGGHYYAPETYTRNVKHGDESFIGVPDLKTIVEEYARGATVALPAIHRTWKTLGSLCDHLQSTLDHAAHANVYITPGSAKGFTPHYDVHEVLVLQIAGRKRWQLYEPVIPLPHRTQLFRPDLYNGQAPMAEIELDAGDFLYLPRGVLHSTTTAESFSAHVTIGITVYTWADLIKELLNSAVDEEEMRRALPPGFATHEELRPLLKRKICEMWEKLRPQPEDDWLIDGFTSRVRASRNRVPQPFRADVTVISLHSRLQAPLPESYRITEESGKTMLEFNDTRYQMPAPVASAMRDISKLRSFRPADLIGALDAEGVLGLSRHLIDIGFLTIVAAERWRE